MRTKMFRYFSGDFETTVYKGQTSTEVWASACVELWTEDVKIFHSIDEQFEYFKNLEGNICCYYHNLKFDGAFWLDFLLTQRGFTQAYYHTEGGDEESLDIDWLPDYKMPNNTVKYLISDTGAWYSITIKANNKIIVLRDSLKLLPFSVKEIGNGFKTKHQKLDMEYEGFRYAGCTITPEEMEYIANDVLVVKEALEVMFEQGHKKLTIGSCCLEEYKNSIGGSKIFALRFPDIYSIPLDDSYGSPNAGEYIRRSYKGGWCYVVKGKENKKFYNGITADVNSLYPSVMSGESLNYYPTGNPTFWKGNYIPDVCQQKCKYFFVRIRTRFYLKPGYLPFIQLKSTFMYKGNECLESSDVYVPGRDAYYSEYVGADGKVKSTHVTLTLTQTDWELINEHYDLVDCEILDGCYFDAQCGIFDEYINHYKQIKMTSTGALRQTAKLFLNNLYGKMATNTNSSFKVAYTNEKDNHVQFFTVPQNGKKAGYIPVGSAITSYARAFTIRTAQLNYHGVDQPGFIYADTDSIHCDLPPEELKGIRVHPTDFLAWKLEASWDVGWFVRAKTYIEHVVAEDLEPVEPFYNVKCAGMPPHCKELFIKSMGEVDEETIKNYNDEERKFLSTHRTIEDFKYGLTVPGKLLPKHIPGGVVLQETTFRMRET